MLFFSGRINLTLYVQLNFVKKSLSIFIFIFFIANTGLFSQTGQSNYTFKRMPLNTGLSFPDVNCIFKDHKGFLWLGTLNGLNQYDGIRFFVYKNIKGDSTSLPSNIINSIMQLRNHNLLICTSNGVSEFLYNEGHFRNYRFHSPKTDDGILNSVTKAVQLNDSIIIIQSFAQIIRLNKLTNKYEVFDLILNGR
mgnify:CR=1 FL=1